MPTDGKCSQTRNSLYSAFKLFFRCFPIRLPADHSRLYAHGVHLDEHTLHTSGSASFLFFNSCLRNLDTFTHPFDNMIIQNMKVWFMWDACSLQEVPFHPETVLRFNSTVLFSNRSINREGNSPCRELLLPSCHYQYLHPSRFTRVHFLVFLMAMTQWPPILRCFKINETQLVDGGEGTFLSC